MKIIRKNYKVTLKLLIKIQQMDLFKYLMINF